MLSVRSRFAVVEIRLRPGVSGRSFVEGRGEVPVYVVDMGCGFGEVGWRLREWFRWGCGGRDGR